MILLYEQYFWTSDPLEKSRNREEAPAQPELSFLSDFFVVV